MPDRFGFPGGGFADHHIPGKLVEILTDGSKLIDAFLKTFPQIIEPGRRPGSLIPCRRGLSILFQLPPRRPVRALAGS